MVEPTAARAKNAPVYWRGYRLAQQGRWADAVRLAQRTLRATPDHLGALEVLCQGQLYQNDPEAALLTLRRMTRLNPNEIGYEILKATALQSLGRLHEALQALTRALERSKQGPQRAQIEREISNLIECLGDYQELSHLDVLANRPIRRTGPSMTVN